MKINYFKGSNGKVNCFINGWCNHADTTIKQHDFGRPDPVRGDWVDDWANIEVCTCGAWRDTIATMGGYWIDEANQYEREEQQTAKSLEFWNGVENA